MAWFASSMRIYCTLTIVKYCNYINCVSITVHGHFNNINSVISFYYYNLGYIAVIADENETNYNCVMLVYVDAFLLGVTICALL